MTSQNQFVGAHRSPNDFDFLKPTNILFGYFTALIESYTKILNTAQSIRHPDNGLNDGEKNASDLIDLEKIKKYASDRSYILEKGRQRYQYEKYQ